MATSSELGESGLNTQHQIQFKAADVIKNLGQLIFLQKNTDQKNTTHIWREPGLIVALENETVRLQSYTAKPSVSPSSILEAVAATTNLEETKILETTKRRPIVTARQIAMYMTREYCYLSLPCIAKTYNLQDHTTVLYAVRKIERALANRNESEYNNYIWTTYNQAKFLLNEQLQVAEKLSGQEFTNAVAVTIEGLYLYPTFQIDPMHARLMVVPVDELVLDKDRRSVSNPLIRNYGAIAMQLLSQRSQLSVPEPPAVE